MRFSQFHLDIVKGFLIPLSEFFNRNEEEYHGKLPIDLSTCDKLCTIFKYDKDQGDPYPF